jgi:hypothetical protein
MKTTLLKTLIVCFTIATVWSCKKKAAGPASLTNQTSVCPLLSIDSPKGNVQNYEWVGEKLIRVYSKDSIPTILVFRYNSKNLAEKMEIVTENSSDKYEVTFQYGLKNTVSKSFVSLNGLQFMTNEFNYDENYRLGSVNTTVELFGRKVTGKTRLEYLNDNVSKVFSSINNEPDVISFSGEKYDSKNQFNPEVYKTAALGFVGIANNFFSYFGKNNIIDGKIYDEYGKLDQETIITYKYTSKGLPLESETTSIKDGQQKMSKNSYQFACK